MSGYEILTLYVSGLAVLASIATAVYARILSTRQSTSDYQSTEQVKSDTAKLLAALRSLMHKGALSASKAETIDISSEREAISSFLNSPTGFAYYSWVDNKDSEAILEGRKSESWRLFFLYLAELSIAENAYAAGCRAADVELLFDRLTEADVAKIAAFNSNLIRAIAENARNRGGNIVVKAFVSSQKDKTNERNNGQFVAKLTYLKDRGIRDPDIDMFLAVFNESREDLQNALDVGANPQTTDSSILEKYKVQLQEYETSR